jgi:hypothetical protein
MMSATANAPKAKPVPGTIPVTSSGLLGGFRLIPAFERDPGHINFACTIGGKLYLVVLFGTGLVIRNGFRDGLILTAILSLATFLPQHRRLVLTGGTLVWLVANPFWFSWILPKPAGYVSTLPGRLSLPALCSISLAAVFAFGALVTGMARRHPRSLLCTRPVLALGLLYGAILLFASYGAPYGAQLAAWLFLTAFGGYFWFIAYAVADQRARDRDSVGLELGTFRPFWGSTSTPLPKGAAYLRRIEAKDAQELAVSQWKALKLFIWACLLSFCNVVFTQLVHGPFHIPTFQEAFNRGAAHAPYPVYVCWLVLVAAFAENLFTISVWGHTIIACCRMAGFRALRNTYRPLTARTIAEFWNRYYFYFKELLVDFFFYPTFFRLFKGRTRVRLATATFAAAGLGNMFFHFTRDVGFIPQMGLWRALLGFHVYAFYCLVLSTGIIISQLRTARRRVQTASRWSQFKSQFGVLLFFCLLQVFDDPGRTHPITVHFAFFLHLFGIGG